MFAVIDLLWLVGGVALGAWLDRKYGDKIYSWFKSAEDVAGALNDRAKAILDAAKK